MTFSCNLRYFPASQLHSSLTIPASNSDCNVAILFSSRRKPQFINCDVPTHILIKSKQNQIRVLLLASKLWIQSYPRCLKRPKKVGFPIRLWWNQLWGWPTTSKPMKSRGRRITPEHKLCPSRLVTTSRRKRGCRITTSWIAGTHRPQIEGGLRNPLVA